MHFSETFADKNVRHVLGISGGKDSAALLAKHASKELELKGEVYYQNGWNVLRLSEESQNALK